MSESPSASPIPENIGRNDPCPCGSGQKYKKCCQRAHRLQRESEKKSSQPHQLIGESTIPLKVFKTLQQVQANNALGLYFELSHDAGPLRARFSDKEAFVTSVDRGENRLPAGREFDFIHMRLDAPDTYLLLRHDDPKQLDTEFQIIILRPNEIDAEGNLRDVEHKGFRIWDVRAANLPRSETNGTTPSLSAFGIEWRPVAD